MSDEPTKPWDMVVQVPLTGFWGTDAEHDLRGAISDAMERQLQESGLGKLGGADGGSGTVNFFVSKIEPENWDRVVEMWVAELQRQGVAERSLIVREIWFEDEDRGEWTVVWPVDYDGEFSLFG